MATNIAPHNLTEAIEATCYLIDNPDATVDELMQIMPGPDFPTGAIIMGSAGIKQSYETGRGSITVRAKAHVESTKTGRSRLGLYRDSLHGQQGHPAGEDRPARQRQAHRGHLGYAR